MFYTLLCCFYHKTLVGISKESFQHHKNRLRPFDVIDNRNELNTNLVFSKLNSKSNSLQSYISGINDVHGFVITIELYSTYRNRGRALNDERDMWQLSLRKCRCPARFLFYMARTSHSQDLSQDKQ